MKSRYITYDGLDIWRENGSLSHSICEILLSFVLDISYVSFSFLEILLILRSYSKWTSIDLVNSRKSVG